MLTSTVRDELNVTGIGADYAVLADLLDRSGAPVPLAELHGGLCGVICASGRRAAESWLEGFVAECAGDQKLVAQLAPQLETLGNDTYNALSGMSLEFEPLLPSDDSAVELRAEALARWCHGFLAGLVVGGLDFVGGERTFPVEIEELVRDFAEISRAGAAPEEIGDLQQGDSALVELEEYVRVGAQLVFEELTQDADVKARQTIH